jgi:putative ABC transport system permease protein
MINNPISFQMPLEAYYFLGALALLVMLTAGFNYTNLSIARSLTRAKEVGVRKVSGAFRQHLFVQFVGESVLLALLALGVGIVMFQFIKSGFTNLWVNQYLNFEFPERTEMYLYFAGFGVVIGTLAGLYPALYMSHYTPLKVLRNFTPMRSGGVGTRKVLITVQFTFSLIFIVSALIFYRQLNHYLHLEYGFSQENILNVELQGQPYEQAHHQLSQVASVEDISGCWFIPASGVTIGKNVQLNEEDQVRNFNYMAVTPNYFSNHQIPMLAGRTFSTENAQSEVVINEKALEALGFADPQQAVGTTLLLDGGPQKNGSLVQVTGVIRDFQDGLPIQDINALLLQYDAQNIKIANVRVLPTDIQQTLTDLNNRWSEIDPMHPMEAKFLKDQLNTSLQLFVDIFKVFGFLTFLAISIALLGLLGMAVFTAESRVKEVGIRKVLGASPKQLVFLLSKGYLQLLIVAIVIAVPLAYFGNNLWLQNFANQVPIDAEVFLLGIAVMLGLGLVVVVSQTLKAATANPVDSLKDE